MLKKVIHGIIAGSLVLAAQVASADSTQFLIDGTYRGVADLPFATAPASAEAVRGAEMPKAPTQEQLERLQALRRFAAPYNMEGGYFN